jgi:hypothetical protein
VDFAVFKGLHGEGVCRCSFLCCVFGVFFILRQAMDDQRGRWPIWNVFFFRGNFVSSCPLYELFLLWYIYQIRDTLLSVFQKKDHFVHSALARMLSDRIIGYRRCCSHHICLDTSLHSMSRLRVILNMNMWMRICFGYKYGYNMNKYPPNKWQTRAR